MLFTNILILLFISLSGYLVFVYWSDMPLFFKVFWPIIMLICLVWIVIAPFNGLFITKKGTGVFIPDFRIKVFKIDELKRLSIIFNEQENKRYSVTVKIIYKDCRVFSVDYSDQFKQYNKKTSKMFAYTVYKTKVEKTVKKLSQLGIVFFTVIDAQGKIVYQTLNKNITE